MTKSDTLGGKKTELRIVTPMSDKAIASAICSAEHAQKKTVRLRATESELDLEQQSGASRSKKLKDCHTDWTG
jgi:hypothetical protein